MTATEEATEITRLRLTVETNERVRKSGVYVLDADLRTALAAYDTLTDHAVRLARLHDEALGALASAIHVASDKSAADAVEWIGDWCNAHDAVDEGDIANFRRWVERGRP